MPRFKLIIEYDGTPFVGWQVQDKGVSVQGAIAAAVAAFSGETVPVQGAGRTDAGVHALGQVAHVDLDQGLERRQRPRRAEFPSAAAADRGACGGARRRQTSTHASPQPSGIISIASSTAAPISRSTSIAPGASDGRSMPRRCTRAAQSLIGKHDFTTFRATECQAKSPVKTLDRLDVTRSGEELHVTAAARSFLHHQVRSMVGSLVHVGEGKWSADDLAAALAARDRARCGQVAPPQGLYLVRVEY